jgi:uncharacterized protein (TIGR03067 family)
MLTAIVLLALAAPTDPPKEKEKELPAEAKKELKKLEGKWQIVKAGSAKGESDAKELELFCEIKGAELTFTKGDKKETLRVSAVDSTTDPKCIDLLEQRPGKPDRTLEGIYKIDGDTFVLAFSIPSDAKNRPTSFDKPGERTLVWTLKRVKE